MCVEDGSVLAEVDLKISPCGLSVIFRAYVYFTTVPQQVIWAQLVIQCGKADMALCTKWINRGKCF